jgi:hypothetical protein
MIALRDLVDLATILVITSLYESPMMATIRFRSVTFAINVRIAINI